ncbi:glycine/betaine ABC transporter substrate-binding protein [Sphaerisporangium krabiense]|uniref:Osmoprotectant transport system substrate-binding protein n=1 Tax=Sphaerisporangium krabiense TaxID=763782 RepID=A0A7W8Z5G8_9ACTN|nr:ABC transporter substrate-binding protein [Sphaerisporangium krabiense]MBB5627746.1 osmoprotectant transport system substrate-binding protein [Sphaerisporangium krabiense]GII61904.1 glycine/betaine ABC transporter substrate-binding protein [Sphaerisporangium krabiense]
MRRIFATAAVTVAAVLTLGACGDGGDPLGTSASVAPTTSGSASAGKVVVGSANFPENVLLASIYSQALQAKGVQVEEKFNIGSREVIIDQIKSGALTVLPEYNGGLLGFIDPKSTAASKDDVNAELKSKLPAELEILDSSAAEDKDSLTVTKEAAAKDGLTTIEDLAKVAKNYVVGGPPEFKKRREAQFKDVYGITFKEWKSTGETTADAIKSGAVQVGNVFTTDPKILINGLVPLQDPKNVFSAQNVTPLVNKAGANDTVRTTLNAISAKLDTNALVDLMKRVAVEKDDPPVVAKDWLTQNGLA